MVTIRLDEGLFNHMPDCLNIEARMAAFISKT